MGNSMEKDEGVRKPYLYEYGVFSALRERGFWPTLYGPLKTAVGVDVLEAGLILAFVMLAFCFYIILPGIRGNERVSTFIRVTVSLFLGACVVLCNWGQEWEVGKIETETQYRANVKEFIHAEVGIKIGLRNVNITLKADDHNPVNETINYNERFWWSLPWHQGRIGFGPYSASINQQFRAAQFKGLPYPILWVAEYFTFDGEGIRWGRNYRTAGWYTHIMLWAAFPCWLLANILFFINPRYGGYMTMFMGMFMVIGNILWASIRNFNELVIPFDNISLAPHYGWCFWLNLIAGLLSIIIGVLVIVLDICMPDSLATFFGVDPSKDYEEFYPDQEPAPKASPSNGDAEINGSNGASATAEAPRVQPQFRKRGFTLNKNQPKPRPVAPPRQAPQPVAETDDGMELYENTAAAKGAHIESVHFEEQ